jgi:uncharacterized protein (DUF3820 family)
MKTIHHLTAGYASCGMEGLPQDWPEDHLWADEWEHVTCQGCLDTKPILPEKTLDQDLLKLDVSKSKPRAPGEKRKEPCFADTDPMPFGKHKGELLQDVPASYLCWLWSKRPITEVKLENYIHNKINALKKEHTDGIWT